MLIAWKQKSGEIFAVINNPDAKRKLKFDSSTTEITNISFALPFFLFKEIGLKYGIKRSNLHIHI